MQLLCRHLWTRSMHQGKHFRKLQCQMLQQGPAHQCWCKSLLHPHWGIDRRMTSHQCCMLELHMCLLLCQWAESLLPSCRHSAHSSLSQNDMMVDIVDKHQRLCRYAAQVHCLTSMCKCLNTPAGTAITWIAMNVSVRVHMCKGFSQQLSILEQCCSWSVDNPNRQE